MIWGGLEGILGAVLDWLGLDLRTISWPRRMSLIGAVLLIGGIYLIWAQHDDSVAILGGVLCAMVGAAGLGRIIVNFIAFVRAGPTFAVATTRALGDLS